MKDETVKISIEIEAQASLLEKYSFLQELQSLQTEKKSTNIDLSDDLLDYKRKTPHFIMQGLMDIQKDNSDYYTARELHRRSLLVSSRLSHSKNPVSYISSILSNLWKEGLVTRIESDMNSRGRPTFGYRVSPKGERLVQYLGRPEITIESPSLGELFE